MAAELAGRDGALQILDVRESRSSVAGVLIAAAAEGVAFFAFVDDAHADGGGGSGGCLSPDVARIVASRARTWQPSCPMATAAARAAEPAAAAGGRGAGRRSRRGSARGGRRHAGCRRPPRRPASSRQPEPSPRLSRARRAPAAPDLLHDPRLALSDSAAQGLATAGPASRTSEILTSLVARHTIALGNVAPDGSFTITMVDGAPSGRPTSRRATSLRSSRRSTRASADRGRLALADRRQERATTVLQRSRPPAPHPGRLRPAAAEAGTGGRRAASGRARA